MKEFTKLFLLLFANLTFAQQPEYEIFNTSINTEFAEFGVTYSNNNSVIFASSKKTKTEKRHNNRQLHLELYHGIITENGDIIESNKFSKEIKNKFYESDIAFTPDFKTIYFTWNNFYITQRKDSAKWKTLYMFKASINDSFEISNVTPLPFNNKEYSVRSPYVSPNGKQLFFISDMPSGYGGQDIYVVDILPNNEYSKPENLGPLVNTKKNELFPFIDTNNRLYFSSYGHKGLGFLDIFRSEKKDGIYQKPENLPAPINSKYDDFAYVGDNLTNSGYFTSNRKGSKGDVDIYAFKLKEEEIECFQTITGVFVNEKTGEKLDNIQVSLYQNNIVIDSQIVGLGNTYTFKTNCNENYKIIAKNEKFKSAEIEIKTSDKTNSLTQNINLIPIECVQTITGIFVNEKTGEKLDNIQVSLYQNNKKIESQIIGLGNTYTFKTNCNETYKIVAQNEKFKTSEIEIKTGDKSNSLTKNINLIPIECVQTITGVFVNEKTGEKLDNIQVSLYQNNKEIESQIVALGNTYTFKTNCNENYKIVVQNEKFITAEVEIKTSDKSNSLTKNINLTPVECFQTITGVFVNEKTGEKLDNIQVSLYQNNIVIDSQIVGLGNTYTFKTNCNENYKIIAKNEKFKSAEIEIKTSDKTNSLTQNINLIPIECVQTITGIFVNEKTGEKLDNIQVSLYQNNKKIESQIIGLGNTYTFKTNCNETYKIVAQNEKFKTSEIEIKTGDKSNSLTKNINLIPIECVQTITGVFVNEKTGEKLDNIQVSLYQNNKEIESQIVALGNTYTFKTNCNENYKIVVQNEKFITAEVEIKTSDKSNSLTKNINLTPVECVQTITGVFVNEKTGEKLDNIQVSLYQNNKEIESQIVALGNTYNFKSNCNENYKIIAKNKKFKTTEVEIKTGDKSNSITQNINLTPVGCVQTISGFIFNKNTGIQLDNVEVSLYQDNLLIEKQKVKLYSKYNFKITCNENYKITAQIEGFETTEIDISTNDLTSINLSKDIALIPFKCVQLLTGVVLNDETKDPLPYSQIKVFNENSIIDTIQSDANANFKYELNCKTNYQFIISLINYKNSVTQIQTSNKPNDVIFKEFLIESNVEFVTVRNNKMAKTKPIYFDLNQDAIRPDAAIELTKVVDLMNKYPSMKIEIKSHTDSRAPDNYNLDLTNKRAESSINYIISKGIDSKRISGRGYGETELLNKCSNGVKCTDAEHEQNRRMEFIVIEE